MIDLNNTDIWEHHLNHIMLEDTNRGNNAEPRGIPIIEALGVSITIDMETPIINHEKRKLNQSFMFGEAYWILSGSNDLEGVARYMKKIRNYSDNGSILSGAYGPHVVRQLEYVKRTLLKDRDSRQAVLTIWQERPEPSKDIPCTVSLQFLLRNNKLNCVAYMRSSDAYIGLPYDLFVFSCISARVSEMLGISGITLGELTVCAGSAHIYKDDYKCALPIALDLYEIGNNDKTSSDFDIYAKSGIVPELRRVLEGLGHEFN